MNQPVTLNKHVLLAVLSASMLVFVMQFGMVSVSFAELTEDLGAPLRWSGWVLTIFMVGQVVALPVLGRLSERFGDGFVFSSAYAVFALASLVCALSPNVYVLVLARAVQGAAGGGLIPSGTSIIARAYGDDATRPVGLYSSLMPLGAIAGPIVGGLIVESWGWRWTFGFNAPFGLVIAALGFLFIPRGDRRAGRAIDYAGVALLGVMVITLIFALTELGRDEASPDMRLVSAALGGCAFAALAFVWHERRVALPVVDFDLLRMRPLVALYAIAFGFGIAWIGVSNTIPLYAQTAYGMSPAESGGILSPRAGAMVVASFIAAMVLPRTGFRWPLGIGLIGMAGSLLLLGQGIHEPTLLGVTVSNVVWLAGVITLAGILFGVANPAMNTAAIDISPERVASVVGLRTMFMNLGGAIGIALVVLVASRASTTAGGIEVAASGLGVLMLASTVLVSWIPNRPGQHRSQDTEAGPRPIDIATARARTGRRDASARGAGGGAPLVEAAQRRLAPGDERGDRQE